MKYNATIGTNYSSRARWTARINHRRREDARQAVLMAALVVGLAVVSAVFMVAVHG